MLNISKYGNLSAMYENLSPYSPVNKGLGVSSGGGT